MRKYLYNYQTTVQFGGRIAGHSILLRCQPCNNAFQNVEEEHFIVPRHFWLRHGTDAYGNRITFGGTRELHDVLTYVCAGIVAVGDYQLPDSAPPMFYRFPTPRTLPTEEMREAVRHDGRDDVERALAICHDVYAMMTYAPQTTDITTTAQQVFASRNGVCQDYAHLMLAFCHANGITARYANGFLEGEGETHAWVEVYDGYGWVGIDPTHDRMIERGYVKIAHGRDALDCPVNRGTYIGNVTQQTSINVTLTEI